MNNKAFTLVEMLMTIVIISFMFVAVNSMLVMTMRKHLANSFSESEEQNCLRAVLEINGYIRQAHTIEITNSSQLRLIDKNTNTLAKFMFVGNTLVITNVMGQARGFTYCENISSCNFQMGSSGLVDYSFKLQAPTGNMTFSGAARPNL